MVNGFYKNVWETHKILIADTADTVNFTLKIPEGFVEKYFRIFVLSSFDCFKHLHRKTP